MPPPIPESPPLIALRGIRKTYPGIVANDGIDLAMSAGEIHALLGENGAGKSTLVKIMAGIVRPDSGEIVWRGEPVRLDSPAAARRLGIGLVFQHFTLFETLTVTENIMLAAAARTDGKAVAARIAGLSSRYGLAVEPDRYVHDLSVGERQRVEILRCLSEEPQLVILDEPTAVLTPGEIASLFATLGRLAAEGHGILFISHKLEEVRTLCQRATILRAGRRVATCDPRRESTETLARHMVGSEPPPLPRRAAHDRGPERLRLNRLDLPPAAPHEVPLEGLDLTVRAGEILGIAGVAGNGQSELLKAIDGERAVTAPESIRIDGVAAGRLGPAARRKLGMAIIPEERIDRGAVGEMSLAENAVLTAAGAGLVENGIVRADRARRYAANVIEEFSIAAPGPEAAARNLSGGNLQRFILGREILRRPKLLVAAHPTRGLDIVATASVQRALVELCERGTAILIVSEDLDELLALCDRIIVISKGRFSPSVPAARADRGAIGAWMSGLLPTESASDAA